MAIAHVQSGKNAIDPSGTSVGRAYSSAVGSGSLLIAQITWWSQTSTAPSVSDSVNGAWTVIGTPVTSGATQVSILAYRANTGAGTPTVTASWGSAVDFPAISTYEFSGAATSSPVDVSATAGPTAGTAVSLGAMTLAEAGELVFMVVTPTDLNRTFTPGSGMTAGQESLDGGSGWGYADFYGIVASAGSFTPTATINSSTTWKARGTAFKAGAAVVAPPSLVMAPRAMTYNY